MPSRQSNAPNVSQQDAARADVRRTPVPAVPHGEPFYMRMWNRLFRRSAHPLSPDEWPSDGTDEFLDQISKWWEEKFRVSADRIERYRVFREMDSFGLISSAMDLYAEEATQKDYDKGRAAWIESRAQHMVTAGDQCLFNAQVEDRIFAMVRRACAIGDDFRRVIYSTGKGVLGLRYADPAKVHRKDDKYDRLIGFSQDGKKFRGKKEHSVSWPWDYIHFRLLGRDDTENYGTAILNSVFRSWRQLTLAEDAVLLYRIRRAPDRNVIYVDVRDMDDVEAIKFVNTWRKRFRKHEFIDPASPDYRKRYNPLTPIEDLFWPVHGQQDNSRIEPLSGSGNMDQLFDIEHWTNKFFATLKIPKAYMGYEGDINAKSTLMQQDVRFARGLKRVQKMAMYGLRQLLDIHYTLLDTDDNGGRFDIRKNPYLVQMSPISYLDEWERLELIQLRYQIVESMSRLAQDMQFDPRTWAIYVLLNYAKLPEELVLKLLKKTPDEPPPMGAGGEGMMASADFPKPEEFQQWMNDPENREKVNGPLGTAGFYQLGKGEVKLIAECVHSSPLLRRCIGDLHNVMMEDASLYQTDPSLVPPRYSGSDGRVIEINDDYADDKEARILQEHTDELKAVGGTKQSEEDAEQLTEEEEPEATASDE